MYDIIWLAKDSQQAGPKFPGKCDNQIIQMDKRNN